DRLATEPANQTAAGGEVRDDGFKDVVVVPSSGQIAEADRNVAKSRTIAGLAPHAFAEQQLQQSSQFLGGSVCANFIFAESNGNYEADVESWSDADLHDARQGAYEALLGWQGSFPSMDLSFVMNVFERVATGYEPIMHTMQNDP